MKLFDLSGRLALVTGSSRGIGLTIARALAAAGASLVLNGRDEKSLAATGTRLAAEGFTVHESPFDVTDAAAVEDAVAAIESGIGPIDILVNNAGMQHRAPLDRFPPDAFEKLLRLNVGGVFLVSQAVARRMIPRGRGRIINIGSATSELARRDIAPYSATKGAVKLLTRGMAADWARHGLQINAIGPGYFKTELNAAISSDPEFNSWLLGRTPAARWGELSELAGAAIFLASDAASFVNGHMLYVDGGITATL